MQEIVFEDPYEFVPPSRRRIWPALLKHLVRTILRRSYGVEHVEFRGLEHYRRSLQAGDGILLAANHCRPADPLAVGTIVKEVGQPIYVMASWHLFKQSRFQRWMIQRSGAFSIYREGVDRQAITTAIDILVEAERPLLLFPEGAVSRTNDLLQRLLEGTSFIAHTAAKRRAKASGGRVVVHPVITKYVFKGDLERSLTPVLDRIERRLSWQPQHDLSLLERIFKLGDALLTLKELEYLSQPHEGKLHQRIDRLREAMLAPAELQWGSAEEDGGMVDRCKRLRMAIVPEMITGNLDPEERRRRWRYLTDIYYAQQLSFYPPAYVQSNPTPERLLETVEKFDEDLHDEAEVHRPWHAILQFGEAIEVDTKRVRGEADPLMTTLEERMRAMLEELQAESGPALPLPDSPLVREF